MLPLRSSRTSWRLFVRSRVTAFARLTWDGSGHCARWPGDGVYRSVVRANQGGDPERRSPRDGGRAVRGQGDVHARGRSAHLIRACPGGTPNGSSGSS